MHRKRYITNKIDKDDNSLLICSGCECPQVNNKVKFCRNCGKPILNVTKYKYSTEDQET